MNTPPEPPKNVRPSSRRKATSAPETAAPVKAGKVVGKPEKKPKSKSESKSEKSPGMKMKKLTLHVLEAEQEELVALKHALSDTVGKKVRKEELLRVAVSLLLKQPHSKVATALAAFNIGGEKEAD